MFDKNISYWIQIYFDWMKIYFDIMGKKRCYNENIYLLNTNFFWLNEDIWYHEKNWYNENMFYQIQNYFDWMKIYFHII